MERSEIKTADSNSGGYFKVSVVKISARSDEVKGKLSVAQSCDLDEKPVFEKNEK
jgi:hypothetical protein